MRNNKILSAAIMTALAGAGASPFASAATALCELGLGTPQPTTAVNPWGGAAPTLSTVFGSTGQLVATEIIGDGWLADSTAGGTARSLTSKYSLGGNTGANISFDFYVEYKLTGAKFVLTSDTATSVTAGTLLGSQGVLATDFRGQLASGALGNDTPPAGSQTSVSFAALSTDQTTVKFLVQSASSTNVKEGDTLYFSFDIKDFDVLAAPSGTVDLTVTMTNAGNGETLNIAPACTKRIATSQNAVTSTISSKAKDGVDSPVYIDVETANTKFTSDRTADRYTVAGKEGCFAVLGSLDLLFTGGVKGDDLFTDIANLAALTPSDATFTVENAPLNATGSTICLDLGPLTNGVPDGACDLTNDLPKVTAPVVAVDGTSASFKLAQVDVTTLDTFLQANPPVNILIGVDCANAVALKQLDDPARGTLVINYGDDRAGGNKNLKYSGTLKYIKRNGTECTLYNIPGPGALENANVRVTNKSGKDSKLWGILVAKDGSKVFGDSQVPVELGAIKNQETRYFDTKSLNDVAVANGWNASKNWGRGVLRIISSATKLEAYGLIRQPTEDAPLQNMSVGASGNGCD